MGYFILADKRQARDRGIEERKRKEKKLETEKLLSFPPNVIPCFTFVMMIIPETIPYHAK